MDKPRDDAVGRSHMTADTHGNSIQDDSAAIEHFAQRGINIHSPMPNLLCCGKQFSR